MVFWVYFHSYWSYITRSSYSNFGYLHDFPQCLHWFYPLIHLGFHALLFLLILPPVSSNVKNIIHNFDDMALKFKTPLCLYIYLNFLFVWYISFIKLEKYFIKLRPSILIYPTLPPHQLSTTRGLSLYLFWTGLRGPVAFSLLGGWVPNPEQIP